MKEHPEHGHAKWMIAFMGVCLAIGALGIFYRSFYLDLAFVLTMGFCVGHHLWHRFKHRRHDHESGTE